METAQSVKLKELTPLVHKIVRGFQRKLPCNVLRDDLISAGMIGLWDAISRGFHEQESFEWYASVRIRGAIVDELRNQDWLSRSGRAAAKEVDPEVSSSFFYLEGANKYAQQEALQYNDDCTEQVNSRRNLSRVRAILRTLPKRDQDIMSRCVQGEKLKDVAKEYGLSEPRISQIHSRVVQTIKKKLRVNS